MQGDVGKHCRPFNLLHELQCLKRCCKTSLAAIMA